MIKNIRLFVNNNDQSIALGKIVRDSFIKNGFNIDDNNFDLGIAIGGDGSFLRMVKATNFDSNPYYVGINSGTLGFLQEVKKDEVDKLIDEIKHEKYKIDEIGIQETHIKYQDGEKDFYSLNEIAIRDSILKVLKAKVYIENDLLETFTGDGLIIATSSGSTAHNLCYNGAIVYNGFSTLQITPLGPINSTAYQTLPNSVIFPSNMRIIIKPENERNILLAIDGNNVVYNDVDSVETVIKDKKIKCLRFSHYNFPQKINEKLLSNKN
jgi:NAD+ kinase